MRRTFTITFYLVIIILLTIVSSCHQKLPKLPKSGQTAKPWTYWWWMGNAVDKDNIKMQLCQYNDAGIGGVHIIPIYGVKGYEDKFIDFLSPRWVDMLRYTIKITDSLDMGVDITTGTGWPFGGPWINHEFAARKISIKQLDIKGGQTIQKQIINPDNKQEVLLSVFAKQKKGPKIDLMNMANQGLIKWDAPNGKWTIKAIYTSPTEQRVKRAAPGGKGLVIDYFSDTAIKHYLQSFDSAFKKEFPGIRAIYNDSYEVYQANWSKNMVKTFKKQRGYDLNAYLPKLFDTTGQDSALRVLCDYRSTIADMLLKNFTQQWNSWGQEHNVKTRNQAHGSPGNIIDLYAATDIPETESFGPGDFYIPGLKQSQMYNFKQFGRPDPLLMKMASSASHVMGKKLTSSESCTWLDDHFKVSLSQVKPQIDQLFVSGINHIFFHGMTYSPANVDFPGWLFYASTNFNQNSHFWDELPLLNKYIDLCQCILQNSKPDNDIMLYFPAFDIWSKHQKKGLIQQFTVHGTDEWFDMIPAGEIARKLWKQGYCFDYVTDNMIKQIKTSNGDIYINNNNKYKILVIPSCQIMPESTLEKLKQLADKGASIVFVDKMPEDVPGLLNHIKRRKKLTAITKRWQKTKHVQLIKNTNKLEMINGTRKEELPSHGLSFIRKQTKNGKIYFVTNLQDTFREDNIILNTKASTVALYDPNRDKHGTIPFETTNDNKTKVKLRLLPGQSIFIRTFDKKYYDTPWQYINVNNDVMNIEGKWQIEFIDGAPGIPKKTETQKLNSWTNFKYDSLYKYFSGEAKYTIKFALPRNPETSYLLDLGTVRESARVSINGKNIGTSWSLPHQMLINKNLLKKHNTLEIYVKNLSINRIIFMDKQNISWKNFYDINMVHVNYKPYDAAKLEPVQSGLLGPVKILPVFLE